MKVFVLAFEQKDEIEIRLKDLKDFDRKTYAEEINRIKRLDQKIYKLRQKSLRNYPISRKIIDRSYMTYLGSILFKYEIRNNRGEFIKLSEPKLILKMGKGGNLIFSKDNSSKSK